MCLKNSERHAVFLRHNVFGKGRERQKTWPGRKVHCYQVEASAVWTFYVSKKKPLKVFEQRPDCKFLQNSVA